MNYPWCVKLLEILDLMEISYFSYRRKVAVQIGWVTQKNR